MSVFIAVKEFEEDSQLETLGVSIGDFVLSLDKINVRTHDDLAHAITVAKTNGSKSAILTVARGEELLKFDVDPSQPLGVILENRKANDFDWANSCSDQDPTIHTHDVESKRPVAVSIFVYATYTWIAINFIEALDKFQQYNSDGALSKLATNPVLQGPIAGGIIAAALGFAFMIFANHRVGKGQNWARYLFLAYSVWAVINILKFNFLAQVLGISILPGLIRAFLPTLIFLPSSNRWFKTKSKTTGWPLKINIELGGNHQKDSIP